MFLTHFTEITDIKLELGQIKDARPIAYLSRDQIEYGLGWSWTPSRVVQHIRHHRSLVLVARNEDTVIGFAIMQFFNKVAHLDLLAVHPDYQRIGIGKSLVDFIEQSADALDIRKIVLEVRVTNFCAQSFYLALGYQKVRLIPFYYRGMENAIRMIHTL